MRILITGGTGFIGSNLAIELFRGGNDLVIIGNDAEQKIPNFNGKYMLGDLAAIDWKQIGRVDAVFHEAANNATTDFDRKKMFAVNVEASKKLFDRAVVNGCKKIIYASSTAVYGDMLPPYREIGPFNPLNPYAESKLALDEFAMDFAKKNSGVIIVGLRYCNVYGPREDHKGMRASMIYQLAQQMKAGNPKIFRDGEQRRDYIYIKDVVRSNMLAFSAKESCIVNCGSGRATSFNDIIKILNKMLGVNRTPEYIENPYADRYQSFTQCDMSFAKEKLGFESEFDIKKGIQDYYESGFLTDNLL
ncbi:MAG: NAD-dependent epimerase/dehydratase family protein [Patescibacteria group bacterium]